MSEMLKVSDLHVYYGSIHAVKGVSFEVHEGEVVTLIGANGAGKSTILNTVSGLLHPRSGSILFHGKDLHGVPAHKLVGMGLAQVPEGRHVFLQMTVQENLEMGAFPSPPPALRRTWKAFISASLACWNAVNRSPVPFPAASSRCWPWAAP